ncbi:T9SS type A sorting domain-containing protein [Hymenobacter negativus]|uniref:T9SS type A sorting domain-containing protein n=1 Tax=Hymenobacter negativus TaxID=2795026 RepID=A0ABS3QDM5_9BACT|nr:T9SS type A sorting domain-containing protein [Hymenobacter negativus]MBO2009216.1 T9SS type A sorting domain-containing protein [Hymenobacter negativus]
MKKLLLLTGLSLGVLAAQPAVAQYYLVPNLNANQNPSGLNNDDEYPVGGGLGTGWTTLLTGTAASFTAPIWSSVATIPFTFQFNGQAVTDYKIATSGVLTFTTAVTAVPSATNATLPNAQIPDKSVCVWGMAANAGDYIITKTFGTAPRRQHWIQFNSYSKPANTTIFTYWSIVLEEGTNNIYVVDQRSNVTTGLNLTVGVQVNATTATQVAGSPAVNSLTVSGPTPIDNTYYSFIYGTPPTRDLALRTLTLPTVASRQSPIPVGGTLLNLGTQAVTSYTVNYKVNNGTTVSGNVTGANINSQAGGTFSHPTPWQPTAGGNYNLKVWLSNPNGAADQNPSNDTLSALVFVGDSTMRRKVVEESFTSSTCPPCNPGNINVQAVNRANPGKYVVIRYQQNFPAPGNDPYYTAESGARFNFYGLNAIPYLMLDGGWQDNSNSLTTAVLTQYQSKPSVMRVGGSYTLTGGNTVTATAFVRPFLNFPAGRLVAHMVVTERRTVLNARTNGEVEFHDVMKKMLPNQSGTPLPALTSGQNFALNQSFNVSTLPTAQAVEHFDSLRVVVFVQDVITKEVYQGEYMTLRNPLATRTAQVGTAFQLAPNPASGRTTLFVNLTKPETVRVEVLDVVGRKVLSLSSLQLGAGAQELPLNLARAAAGIYTVRLTTSAGVRTQKLTLE